MFSSTKLARPVQATLTGLGSDLTLVGPSSTGGGTPITFTLPSSGDWNAARATLIATPKGTTGLPWAAPVRNVSGVLGALLLIGFIVSLARR